MFLVLEKAVLWIWNNLMFRKGCLLERERERERERMNPSCSSSSSYCSSSHRSLLLLCGLTNCFGFVANSSLESKFDCCGRQTHNNNSSIPITVCLSTFSGLYNNNNTHPAYILPCLQQNRIGVLVLCCIFERSLHSWGKRDDHVLLLLWEEEEEEEEAPIIFPFVLCKQEWARV